MKIAGMLAVVIVVMGGIGYWYYNDTQGRMAILQENNAKLETAVALNEAAIDQMQADFASQQTELNRINQEYAAIRRENNRLANKLANIDLSLLAAEKPTSIERAVNRGTVNAGRCFEILSGSPLTESEINAKDGESFNKECPWLWPGVSSDGVRPSATTGN
jgi:chromosome segregation ATPase